MKLVIDCSKGHNRIILSGGSQSALELDDASISRIDRSLSALVLAVIKKIDTNQPTIDTIAVNIGPGGLNSCRAGISFAKGLAYSSQSKLIPYNGMQIMGFMASKKSENPVICVQRGYGGNYFVGCYEHGKLRGLSHGNERDLVDFFLKKGVSHFSIAGPTNIPLPFTYRNGKVIDSGITEYSMKDVVDWLNTGDVLVSEFPYDFSPLYTYA